MTTTTAAAVSAALRRAGLNPLGSGTPRSREGIRVTGSTVTGRVRVTADLNSTREAHDLANAAVFALTDAGYTISDTGTPAAFYVTGRQEEQS